MPRTNGPCSAGTENFIIIKDIYFIKEESMNQKYTLLLGLLVLCVLPSAAQSQKQLNLGGGFVLNTKIAQEVPFQKINAQFPVKYTPVEQIKFGSASSVPQEPVYVETLCGGQADVKNTVYLGRWYVERGSKCAEKVYTEWLRLQDKSFEQNAQARRACEAHLPARTHGHRCPVCGQRVDERCTSVVKKNHFRLHADCQAKAAFEAEAKAFRYKLGLNADPSIQTAQAVVAKKQAVKALQQSTAPVLPKAVKYQKKDTHRARAEYKRSEKVAHAAFKRQMGYKATFVPDALPAVNNTVGMARAAKKRLRSYQENMRLLKEKQTAQQPVPQTSARTAREQRRVQEPQALTAPAKADKPLEPVEKISLPVLQVPHQARAAREQRRVQEPQALAAPAKADKPLEPVEKISLPVMQAPHQARAAKKRQHEEVSQSEPDKIAESLSQTFLPRAQLRRNRVYGAPKYKVTKKDIKNFKRHYKPQMAQIEEAVLTGTAPTPEIAKAVEQYKALTDSYAYTKTISGKNAYARVAAFEKAHAKDMFLIREWLSYGEDSAPAYYKALVKAYKKVHKEGNLRYDKFKY